MNEKKKRENVITTAEPIIMNALHTSDRSNEMLTFLSMNISEELRSHWNRVHSTTDNILKANPTIVNYWIHIRYDRYYSRFENSTGNTIDEWKKHLIGDHDISISKIKAVYRYIHTSIHVEIEANGPYYAQTTQNKIDNTITITLSARLLQSNTDSHTFVAAAVLLRELTRALWPVCLNSTARFLHHPIFFSWTGMPKNLWPNPDNKQRPRPGDCQFDHITRPSDGQQSLVADAGNLFQHLFFNGEVHLYDDEIDDQTGQIIVQVMLTIDSTHSSMCAARYIDDQIIHAFFHDHQYCLDSIRRINDQTCPHYKYCPIERRGSAFHYIAVDNRGQEERSWKDNGVLSRFHNGNFYYFKPYDPEEPRQHYEQTVVHGEPPYIYGAACGRIFQHTIRTDDGFFNANRSLFRRIPPILPAPSFDNGIVYVQQPYVKPTKKIGMFRRCIHQIRQYFKELNDIKRKRDKI